MGFASFWGDAFPARAQSMWLCTVVYAPNGHGLSKCGDSTFGDVECGGRG